MSNSGKLTGLITNDSPHLHGLFGRFLDHNQVSELSSLYKLIWERGGCIEPTPRREGVSFNPIPARLCTLVMQEGLQRDFVCASATLLSCLKETVLAEMREDGLTGYNDAEAAIKHQLPNTTCVETICIAHDIDLLRHLHLIPWGTDKKHEVASTINTRSFLYTKPDTRLLEMLQAALKRHLP